MKIFSFILFAATVFLTAFQNPYENVSPVSFVGYGGVPDIAKARNGTLHLVFGKGDSILYSYSTDNGWSFSSPEVVDTVHKLFSFAMRGPQIAATKDGVSVIACNQQGSIVSFQKKGGGKWKKTGLVNEGLHSAKEGFMALDGNGENSLFAVWLDLRKNQNNNIYGSRSFDGGKTWLTNQLIYASPDSHVCECCKPSVAIQGEKVAVMFRNWLNGNRDLYLAHSFDNGKSFQQVEKLGRGSWKLAGCPMDGGGLAMNKMGEPQTVWRREGKIFAAEPGQAEREIGEGRSCTIETVNGKNVYAWVEQGKVIVLKPGGEKINLGEGQLPVLKALGSNGVICIWEKEKATYKSVIEW